MTVTDLFRRKSQPPGAPVCHGCNGRGSRKGKCTTCNGVGIVNPRQANYYGCPDCDNYRCRSCGGDGIVPNPLSERPSDL